MRTTLSIDDDVFLLAKSLAERQHSTIGAVLSELVRQGLRRDASPSAQRNGIQLLPNATQAVPVTLDIVNQLRDELA
nr:CopG family transcriptional regulator [uncultured Albidiferax sp.]